ncbi:hypothetical protein [Palleronia sp.]|uniref:hypothetical protein n=1 Tax=Palleronia sp. TaxID=1940284 RepID=UPI0035C7C03D
MTDPLDTALDNIDTERKRLLSARMVVENAIRFRDQAARLGFEPEAKANHNGFGIWVPFHAELVAALAAGGVVPPSHEVKEKPAEPADDAENPHDAGKPWPAVRDDYQPPAPVEQAAEPTSPRATSVGQSGGGDAEALPPREVKTEKPALPPIKDPHGKPVVLENVRKTWTPEEEADLIARVDRGETFAEIAEAINRKTAAVAGKYTYMRSRGLLKDDEATVDTTLPAEPATPEPEQVPIEVTTPAADPVEESSGWTRGEDLELLRLLSSGKSPRVTAEELGRTVDDILARRLLLNPSRHPRDLTRIYHERRMEAEHKEGVSA